MTTTIQHKLPTSAFSALRLAPEDFAREMRIAACVQWYAQGLISQSKAAEIADISRAEFLHELGRRNVSAVQSTAEELVGELRHFREARR
jgi:predicted HTH domain antitoxin